MEGRSENDVITVSIEELKRNPQAIVDKVPYTDVMVCRDNEPVFRMMPIAAWYALLRELEAAGVNVGSQLENDPGPSGSA
ncbi:type II toxin-antitoxin system prevent-host-death family antitoxin [Caballeronia sp. DA-9]|uniref:type II toxin-antitoxin system prevent-host-death family antitoxin n=1 Tax=Caballeronia sp. DA-9 TaxID=3436237 RepID=UPI003F6721CC